MYPAVQAVGLRKSFGDKEVVRGIDLDIAAGSVLAVLGPNGAGKTTTVRMLATLLTPDAGTATVAGHDVVTEAREVRKRIGLTGQFAAVDARLTGRENLELCAKLHKLGRAGARSRATELLEQFDLVDAAAKPAGAYSGGMRRRLDLAASLVARPEVIFLDEPTTGLDPASRASLWDIVRELAASGVAVLLTTQYLEEADQLADRIVVVDDGRIVAQGTAAELKARVRGEQLELTLTPATSVTAVETALVAAGFAPSAVDAAERTVVIPAACGTAVIERTAAAVRAAGGELAGFAVRHPSLDEVFLSIVGATGQPAATTPELSVVAS